MNAIKITKRALKALSDVIDYARIYEFNHWRETGFHKDHIAARILEVEMWLGTLRGGYFAEVRCGKQPIAVIVLGSGSEEAQTEEIQKWCISEGLVLDDIKGGNGKIIAHVSDYKE